jgi:hypothetical protein
MCPDLPGHILFINHCLNKYDENYCIRSFVTRDHWFKFL